MFVAISIGFEDDRGLRMILFESTRKQGKQVQFKTVLKVALARAADWLVSWNCLRRFFVLFAVA